MSDEHVRLLRRETRKLGEDFKTVELEIQRGLTAGHTDVEIARMIDGEMTDFFQGDLKPAPQTQAPIPGTVAGVSDEALTRTLDKLPWKQNTKGTGWYCHLEDLQLPFRASLVSKFTSTPMKYVTLDVFNYTRFGDASDMLGKFPVKAKGE